MTRGPRMKPWQPWRELSKPQINIVICLLKHECNKISNENDIIDAQL